MDTLVCKICHQTSSVTPSSGKIRCSGCGGLISVGETKYPISSGMSKSPKQDQDVIITGGKGLCLLSRSRKASANAFLKDTDSFNHLSSARISDTPRRGKRALLCGVSYKDKKFRLRGTIQDVMSIGDLLIKKFDFPTDSILILAEDGPYETPTKANILRAFEWLMRGLQSGDSLVFFYSGHGLRQLDFNRDEKDGFDEALCPLDFETEGLILDNDINKKIVQPLKQDVTLHAIIDACHSGTALDLVHIFDRNERKWKDNLPPSGCFKGTSGGKAICFSACEDHQIAADTSAFSLEGSMAGAMTHNFTKAIMDFPGITYLGILDYMSEAIEAANDSLIQRSCVRSKMLRLFRRRILQDPLLSSSEIFDVNKTFKL